ncbi:MAG TPA: hypothetical protein VGM20_03410 [Gemmatimonadales bacterium]|jgi:uncharacterized protein (DUF1697 family)
MAQVVFLRGINVAGHRRFRPAVLAKQLKHLDVINVGAAGTFVVRQSISQARLRVELARRLPFDAEIMICTGRKIVELAGGDFFAGQRARPDIVRFVSVLSRRPGVALQVPASLPSRGRWMVKVLAHDDHFVVGLYRREMKVISHLGSLDQIFGAPVTTRNWNTIAAIARKLDTRSDRQPST